MASTASPRPTPADDGNPHVSLADIPDRPPSAAPSASSQDDPMEIVPQQGESADSPAPSATNGAHATGADSALRGGAANGAAQQAAGAAAAAAQQPKVVQTAFIHKLYNMLEDHSIHHLITWSTSGESFLISPTAEFSKVLATYFKHTNVSSFVRQLNMYGFHKVSDVFHTGSPETALWEFKHGNGNFKRGDLAALKEIKRRASRHALIHRDSFSAAPKQGQTQPAGPPEPSTDSLESRLNMFEHTFFEMHNRLAHAEQTLTILNSKCQALSENLTRSYQANIDISTILTHLVQDMDHRVHHEVSNFQADIRGRLEALRSSEMSQSLPTHERQPSFSQLAFEQTAPLSPRQVARNGSLRSSILNTSAHDFVHPSGARSNTASPRRFVSGNANGAFPPNRSAAHPPLAPPALPPSTSQYRAPGPPIPGPPIPGQQQHPYTTPLAGNLLRRHTSADIRSDMNQQSGDTLQLPSNRSSIASGFSPGQLPSPQHRASHIEDVQLRESLARYQLSGDGRRDSEPGTRRFSSSGTIRAEPLNSRPSTPPLPHEASASTPNFGANSFGVAPPDSNSWTLQGPRLSFRDVFNTSGPPTRRSSMAHILNPADTAEREDEDDVAPEELRKRKRIN